jgi:hypothetical protein
MMMLSGGHALEFSMKSGFPGSSMGSGCAAMSIFVPQLGPQTHYWSTKISWNPMTQNTIYSGPSLFNNHACQS